MIDKKITAGVILALIVESAGVFAWAGATGERLRDKWKCASARSQTAERLARVEVKLEFAASQLDRINEKLDL